MYTVVKTNKEKYGNILLYIHIKHKNKGEKGEQARKKSNTHRTDKQKTNVWRMKRKFSMRMFSSTNGRLIKNCSCSISIVTGFIR